MHWPRRWTCVVTAVTFLMLAAGCGATPVPQPSSSPAAGLFKPMTQEPDPTSGSGNVSGDSW